MVMLQQIVHAKTIRCALSVNKIIRTIRTVPTKFVVQLIKKNILLTTPVVKSKSKKATNANQTWSNQTDINIPEVSHPTPSTIVSLRKREHMYLLVFLLPYTSQFNVDDQTTLIMFERNY